jgi:hypothetical protein
MAYPRRRCSKRPVWGHRLAGLPDAEVSAAEPGAGGRRWFPDIQPPTLDGPAGVGGHPRADLIDHQPRPQGHDLGIDRDRLPGARPARGRDALARVAAYLEDAKLHPASAGRIRRRQRLRRPGRARRGSRGWGCVTAGRQEDPTHDSTEQRRGRYPHAASGSSADRHVVRLQRVRALTVLLASTRCKPRPLPVKAKLGVLLAWVDHGRTLVAGQSGRPPVTIVVRCSPPSCGPNVAQSPARLMLRSVPDGGRGSALRRTL